VTISPTNGLGVVTINSSGGGGGTTAAPYIVKITFSAGAPTPTNNGCFVAARDPNGNDIRNDPNWTWTYTSGTSISFTPPSSFTGYSPFSFSRVTYTTSTTNSNYAAPIAGTTSTFFDYTTRTISLGGFTTPANWDVATGTKTVLMYFYYMPSIYI
jgi:hypothetical protein